MSIIENITKLLKALFSHYELDPQIEYSDEFAKKSQARNLAKYYAKVPKVNAADCYDDLTQYLTTEEISILLGHKLAEYKLLKDSYHPKYDLSHVKLIEDKHCFPLLKSYLDKRGKLKDGENIKCLLKIKKGEPSHYNEAIGVHVLPIYIRCVKDELKVFIYDAANGLNADVKDGFDNLCQTLHTYAMQHFAEDKFKIIKTSTITMNDMFHCPIHGLRAIDYFVKKGHKLFSDIKPEHLINADDKACDKDLPYVSHLKTDKLPPFLLAYSSRLRVTDVQKAYRHPWMPRKIELNRQYYDKSTLLTNIRNIKVEGQTLEKTFRTHGFQQRRAGGPLINGLALEKMRQSRLTIGIHLSLQKKELKRTMNRNPKWLIR